MKYEYINSAKYNLNTITKAFEHESRNDFFRICKILKFTIHPYPGPQKNKKKIEDLDRWLKGRLTDEEGRIWDRILRESGYINRLYKDLYSDEEYEQANAIAGSRELSAYLMFVEYYLTSLLNSMRGRNDLNDLLGIQSDLGEIPDVNERMLCYGELFDHVSIEIKNALEYIAFYKNHNQICDRVDTKEILKAKGHLLSVMKKKIIDQIVESWQFGDPVIAMDQDVFLCEQDDWGNRIRTYWEMRERSTYTTSMLAAEQYPVTTDNEEQQEFDRTNFILQRQLYADLSDCRCEIVGKEGENITVKIQDLIKAYARLKTICKNHLKTRKIENLNGNMRQVCVQIKKKDLKRELAELELEDPECVLKLLTYGKAKDLLDAPLLATGIYYYMVPSLVAELQISEVLLSLANGFYFRGKALEHRLFRLLKEENIICGKIKRHESSDTYECDSVFVLEDCLFLVEAKAWGFPANITQYYNMNKKIIEADRQINRLYEYIRKHIPDVLQELGLDEGYKINHIYRIILSNFQRADEQELENSFLCDFNCFRGVIKGIPSGVLVKAPRSEKLLKVSDEPNRLSKITAEELVNYLQRNELLDLTKDILYEKEFCEPIHKLRIKKTYLERKLPLAMVWP
ncbi:hypothetical protein [Diplocloster agilis]|uniref:hypothetical protein n=1 Tax=Diplocloster agilis TaxID=2850323 RepID=UPI0008232581|nr:hypothetical protein [Suonthocola fibrivorans]MCU6735296.1 hypothetical protein [Suonthocola fibrivorans]SCJ69949.1 Uncharacterised protein [uncultured Clostridium sp.]